MKQHKWHKEIKAWADGAKIECKDGHAWWVHDDPDWSDEVAEYRIKSQPVEPQYLYVYVDEFWNAKLKSRDEIFEGEFGNCIGKIPLIVESNDD